MRNRDLLLTEMIEVKSAIDKLKNILDIVLNEEYDLEEKISDLGLSCRSYNALLNYTKIHTVGDLIMCTETDLLKTKNFGRRSLNEIKGILAKRNLHLK